MGLHLPSKRSRRGLMSIASLFALSALVFQSVGAALPSVFALGAPTVDRSNATYVSNDQYKAIVIDINAFGFSDATGVSATVERAKGENVVKTSKPTGSVAAAVNAGTAVTLPVVVQPGLYNEATSGSWNPPSTTYWDQHTIPTKLTLTVTRSGGESVSKVFTGDQISTAQTTYAAIAPQVDSENRNFIDISTTVFHNRNSDSNRNAGEEQLAGWEMRLYRESATGWQQLDTRTTSTDKRATFTRQGEAGTYHVCPVTQLGWEQIKQDWSGTTYHVTTPNNSPNHASEGPYCSTITYSDKSNTSAVNDFGVRYNDQDGSNHLNLSGYVFHNRNGDRDRDDGEEQLNGWTVRAYKEANGAWNRLGETITRATDGKFSFMFADATAGVYHTCLVNQSGFGQIHQEWSGTPFHTATANKSGAADEADWCSTVTFTDAKDSSKSTVFGVRDNEAPVVTIASPVAGSFVSTVADKQVLTVTGTFTDNHTANYVHVQLVDAAGNGHGGVPTVNGNPDGTYTVTFSTKGLADGKYRLYAWGADAIGNVSDRAASERWFTLDNTKPVTTVTSPAEDSPRTFSQDFAIRATTTDRDGGSGIVGTTISLYKDGVSALHKTCHRHSYSPAVANTEFECTAPVDTLEEGGYTARVNSRDAAGNVSNTVRIAFTIDKTAPLVTVTEPTVLTATANQQITIVGTVNDSSVTHVKVTLGDVTVEAPVKDGVWSAVFNGLPAGAYTLNVESTDPAGNITSHTEPFRVTNAQRVVINPPAIDRPAPPTPASNRPGASTPRATPLAPTAAAQAAPRSAQARTVAFTPANVVAEASTTPEAEPTESPTTSSVLSAEDALKQVGDSDVLADTTVANEPNECATFLGICWYWWLPVIVVVAAVIWWLVGRSRRSDTPTSLQ